MAETPIPASAVVTSTHDHGAVLLDTVAGVLFSTNDTGARVWNGLQAHLPLNLIAAELSREFAIPCDVATQHVTAFLRELERHRLIARSAR